MSAFYDVFAEVPTYANIRTAYGNDMDKREEWSKIITEEFDRLQKMDKDFDYLMQLSARTTEEVPFGAVKTGAVLGGGPPGVNGAKSQHSHRGGVLRRGVLLLPALDISRLDAVI
jgi:hypothetical protein